MLTQQLPLGTDEVYACVFSADARRALVSAHGRAVGLWDIATAQLLRAFAHDGPVWALAWREDEHRLLSLDGRMHLWDVATAQRLREFTGHHARCLAWHPDGRLALTASDRQLTVTAVDSGDELQRLDGHEDGIYCAAFSDAAERALSGARDGTVRVWDLDDGRCTAVLTGHTYHVHGVVWSPDQRHAISCAREILLWDVDTDSCLRTLEGHSDTIRSVQWSPDGQSIVSASHDGTVRRWGVASGACDVFTADRAGLVTARLTHDLRQIVACDWRGGIHRWELPSA